MSGKILIHVIMSDPAFNFATHINATFEEAAEYYVGNEFNFGVDYDHMVTCVAVELIPEEQTN